MIPANTQAQSTSEWRLLGLTFQGAQQTTTKNVFFSSSHISPEIAQVCVCNYDTKREDTQLFYTF